jgi:sec-independent protein translocase protein TatC
MMRSSVDADYPRNCSGNIPNAAWDYCPWKARTKMSSDTENPGQLKGWFASFWEHADELIRRFKIVLVALIAATSIGWLPTSIAGLTNPIGGYQPLLSLVMLRVKAVFLPTQATLIAGGMADTVFAMAYLSIILGVLFASPVVLYEVVAFVKPALYENEKKVIGYYMGAFIGCLALGAVMAYFLIIPLSFRILIYFTLQGGAAPFIFIKDFYNWIYTLFALCGVFYTIPVFIVLLVQVGVLPVRFLRGRNKIIIYVLILMVFWIFGPDPTPITGAIMMAPFVVVFETATFIARRIDKARQRRKAEALGISVTPPPSGKGTGRGRFGPTLAVSTCKFCNATTGEGAMFCPLCNKSLR